MAVSASLVWFRHDLRLADNPALQAAVRRGGPIIPVYIWAPQEEGAWSPGAASCWWLHQSCVSLDASLRKRGSRLIIRRGKSGGVLHSLIRETGARAQSSGIAVMNRRIFNPVSQGEKFDPDGTYIRRWVPELARLPANWIHKPWGAPEGVLAEAGVKLGTTYPEPIVDHHNARIRALAALAQLKKGNRHKR